MSDDVKVSQADATAGAAEAASGNSSEWTLEAALKEIEKTRKEAASSRVKLKKYEEEAQKKIEEEAVKNGEIAKLYEESKNQLGALSQEVEAYRKLQQDELDTITKEFKEDDRELIPDSLPLTDKLKLARKLQLKLKATVATPAPGTVSPTSNASGAIAGYKDKDEFATKDPKGFLEMVKKHGIHF